MNRILLFIAIAAGLSCNKAEQIPAYLYLKPFEVAAPGGAAWQEITDGWLYVNGDFLGAYTLPATVPVLAEGESEIILFPGVKEDGLDDTPNIYPYLGKFVKKYELKTGQTNDIQPVTDYVPNLVYAFGIGRGDFDSGSSISLENRDSDGVVNAELTTNGAFAGKSILMQVDTAHPNMDIATEMADNLPILGAPEVWLEITYKNDIPFFLYLLSGPTETSHYIYLFNTSENWNKTYFNLTDELINTATGQQKLNFRVNLLKDNAGNYNQLNGKVLIDNIRIVHL